MTADNLTMGQSGPSNPLGSGWGPVHTPFHLAPAENSFQAASGTSCAVFCWMHFLLHTDELCDTAGVSITTHKVQQKSHASHWSASREHLACW